MAIQINVAGTDRVDSVIRNSLSIDNIVTRQIDRCRFVIRKYGEHTFIPRAGHVVTIYDGATKIFAGNIVKLSQGYDDYGIVKYDIEANDYGRQLDRYLVNDSFQDQSIADIINFIVADKGLDTAGFTTNNVSGTKIVSYVGFKYEPFSSVLTQLAELINYDWYVDYDKDIHFFSKTDKVAPVDIEDTTGVYLNGSLIIRKDNSQVKNVIYVRGGEYLGANFTSELESDGTQNVYTLPYKYDSLQVSVTGEVWDGGIDGTDLADSYDYMWNNEEKFIRIRGDRIPSDLSSIRISGEPFLPVVVKLRDQDSINSMVSAEGGTGEYEHIIIDKSIDSREGARERARAELDAYKETLSEGEFRTYTSGFKAGQRVRINSDLLGVDEYFIVNKVTFQPWTEDAFVYHISLVSTKTLGIIDFLRNILTGEKKKIIINENEILDLVEAYDEEAFISESIVTSTEHNLQSESSNMAETVTAQSLNYETEFVVGPYVPAYLWTSPTGSEDPGGNWSAEFRAYDGDTGTFSGHQNTMLVEGEWNIQYLTLTHPGIKTSKIRMWLSNSDYDLVDVDAYYNGQWNDVAEEIYTADEYFIVDIPDGEVVVTKVRIRVRSAVSGLKAMFIYEVGLGRVDYTDKKRVFLIGGSHLG